MELDVFAVGQADGWVVAPAGARLPMAEVGALGRLQRIGRVDPLRALGDERWAGVARDIDARGYGVLAAEDLPDLLEAANEAAHDAGGGGQAAA